MKTSLAIASFLILLHLAPASSHNRTNNNKRRREQSAACSPLDLDVIIIGAGMSGLAAANWLLAKTNYCIKVIEAQNRVGGRMKSAMVAGELVELGANWISGGNGQPIKTLADFFGSTPYFAMDYASIDFYDTTRPSNQKLQDRDWKPRERDLLKALAGMEFEAEALYEDYYEDFKVDVTDRSAQESLAQQHPKSWTPMTPVDHAIEHWYFQAENIYGTERLSLHNFPDDTFFDFGNFQNFVMGTNINNGIEGLANKFRNYFDPLGQIVRTGEPVTTITYNASRAIVTTNTATYNAKKVILATGIEALRRLANNIHPPIQDLDRFPIELGTEIKVYLKFNTRFWDPSKQIILIATNKTATSTPRGICNFYLNYDFALLKPGSKLLACYIDQDTLDSYYMATGTNLTEAEAMDEAGPILKPLKDAFTGFVEPSAVLSTNWANEEYVLGSWEVWDIDPRRNLTDYYTFIDQPLPGSGQERTLILAGCHACLRYFGYMHGAYYAGTKGAKYAIQSLEASGTSEARPYSPCDDPDVITGAEYEAVPLTKTPLASPVLPPVAAPVAAPVSPPVTTPMTPPIAAPVASPIASPMSPPVTPPVASPVSPPLTPPVASPVAPPLIAPVATPVTPPFAAPVALPVASPISPPETPPVVSPVSPPVTPPISFPVFPPVDPPVVAPVATPVTPPFAAPVALPVASPISPPVTPPIAFPVSSPVDPPVVAPLATSVTPPFAAPVALPVASPISPPVTPPIAFPVSPPVYPPVGNPVTLPVTAPVALPVASPIFPMVTPPVAYPVPLPVTPPVAGPVSPLVTTPVASPATSPVPAPVSPPVTPPFPTLVVPPMAPLATSPNDIPVDAPIAAPVAPPVSQPIESIVDPTTPACSDWFILFLPLCWLIDAISALLRLIGLL